MMGGGYVLATSDMDGVMAAAAGVSALMSIISLVVAVAALVGMWKVFVKAGEPGWAAIVPIYNAYVLFKIAWGKGILFLLMCIPVVNFVAMIMVYVKLAKAFGKGTGFAVGLIFLAPIFMCILGFGDAQYEGPQ